TAKVQRSGGVPWLLDFTDSDGVRHDLPADPPHIGDIGAWCIAIRYYCDLHYAPRRQRRILQKRWRAERERAVQQAAKLEGPASAEIARALEAGVQLPDDLVGVDLMHEFAEFPLPGEAALIDSRNAEIKRRLAS